MREIQTLSQSEVSLPCSDGTSFRENINLSNKQKMNRELEQLSSLTSLCEKLKRYHERINKLQNEKDENKLELLSRKQQREKMLISKLLNTLKCDSHFSIDGNKAIYCGVFVQASKAISLEGF